MFKILEKNTTKPGQFNNAQRIIINKLNYKVKKKHFPHLTVK